MRFIGIALAALLTALTLTIPLFSQENGAWIITKTGAWAERDANRPTSSGARMAATAKLKSADNAGLALVFTTYFQWDPVAKRNNNSLDLAMRDDEEGELFYVAPDKWAPGGGKRIRNQGIPFRFTFDDEKPILFRWSGDYHVATLPNWKNEPLSENEFLTKLQATKKMKVSYLVLSDDPNISHSEQLPAGTKEKSATFDLSGTDSVVAALCGDSCTGICGTRTACKTH